MARPRRAVQRMTRGERFEMIEREEPRVLRTADAALTLRSDDRHESHVVSAHLLLGCGPA
jgi:hypothetical protein